MKREYVDPETVGGKTFHLCNYHRDSLGWDSCSDLAVGCQIKSALRRRKALVNKMGIFVVKEGEPDYSSATIVIETAAGNGVVKCPIEKKKTWVLRLRRMGMVQVEEFVLRTPDEEPC